MINGFNGPGGMSRQAILARVAEARRRRDAEALAVWGAALKALFARLEALFGRDPELVAG